MPTLTTDPAMTEQQITNEIEKRTLELGSLHASSPIDISSRPNDASSTNANSSFSSASRIISGKTPYSTPVPSGCIDIAPNTELDLMQSIEQAISSTTLSSSPVAIEECDDKEVIKKRSTRRRKTADDLEWVESESTGDTRTRTLSMYSVHSLDAVDMIWS